MSNSMDTVCIGYAGGCVNYRISQDTKTKKIIVEQDDPAAIVFSEEFQSKNVNSGWQQIQEFETSADVWKWVGQQVGYLKSNEQERLDAQNHHQEHPGTASEWLADEGIPPYRPKKILQHAEEVVV